MKKSIYIVILLFLMFGAYLAPHSKSSAIHKSDIIRVAIYSDQGVGLYPGNEIDYTNVIADILKSIEPENSVQLIFSKDIENGVLNDIDVVIFPGGSGGGQSDSLNPAGRDKIKEFVENGGGYIGICAGAFIGQSYDFNMPGYSLKLVNASVFNFGRNSDRGEAVIRVRLTHTGKKYFPEFGKMSIIHLYYANGPLMIPEDENGYGYEELMQFESNVYHGSPEGKDDSPGKTFLLRARKGKGVVLLLSGHPEATPGFRWMLPRMVRIAAKRKIIFYPVRYQNFSKFAREVLFTPEWRAEERRLFEIVGNKSASPDTRIDTIEKLKTMKSVELPEKLMGLINDESPAIRKKTAETMIFYDYFPALPELMKAMKTEKNSRVKRIITLAVNYLSNDDPKKPSKKISRM